MSLRTLRDSSQTQLCLIRNLKRVIHSDEFGIAYVNATPARQEFVTDLVERGLKDEVRDFIREELLRLTPFHRMNMKRLRGIGQKLSIERYHTKNKATLVEDIQDEVDRLKENAERISFQPEPTGGEPISDGTEDGEPRLLVDESRGTTG